MPQGLLRTVQGDAIVIAQAIVLKHAFKFHQLGEYRIAVHSMKLDDSATGVSPEAPAGAGSAARHFVPATPNVATGTRF